MAFWPTGGAWYVARYVNTWAAPPLVGPWIVTGGSIYRWLDPKAAWDWEVSLQFSPQNPELSVQRWRWMGSAWRISQGVDTGDLATDLARNAPEYVGDAQTMIGIGTVAVLLLLLIERKHFSF